VKRFLKISSVGIIGVLLYMLILILANLLWIIPAFFIVNIIWLNLVVWWLPILWWIINIVLCGIIFGITMTLGSD